jgi:hypothetical protein
VPTGKEIALSLSVAIAVKTHPFSSTTPAEIYCIPVCTRINSAHFLEKCLQRRPGLLATSDIPQRPRPFADRFIVNVTLRRAANNSGEWIRVLVDWQPSELKRPSQKPCGLSPPFAVHDYREHSF